jgi:TolB protein
MRAARAIRAALTVALVAATWAALAPLAAADDLRPAVVVTPGASQQYGAALQVFADRSATPDPQRAGAFRRAIADALEFSNVFEILDPEAFLGPTSTMSLDAPPPICSDWTVIGADALVEGELQIDGTQASAEFRLWDVARCRRLARKRYRQAGDDPNVIARRIADDIMAAFIGVRGVSSTEIAFVSDRSGSTEIYVMGADGEKPRPATSNRSINNFPDWSPSGDSIVYTSYQRNNRPALYLSTRRGNSPGPVLRDLNGTHQYRGVFDPMGKMMAVVLSKQGAADIYTVRPSGLMDMKRGGAAAGDVDGDRLADVGAQLDELQQEVTRLEGQFDLWLIDPDGSVNVPLISHPRSDESPAWAPNGRKIAFSSKRRGRADIYVVDINGEGLRRLTRNAGSNKSPAWGPFPR